MWRTLLLGVVSWAMTQAGVVQGVVVEHATGRALARTAVFLTPVPGTAASDGAAQPITGRSMRSGQFTFPSVQAGVYILTATRDGYFPGAWGQRLAAGRGAPITVTADSQIFAEIRMRHRGAITGRVLDENGVGAARMPVVAYRARMPLRLAGQATSDDRGVYRIPGLEPGKYWVRSGGQTLEDGTMWLPAFAPQGLEVRDARVFAVTVDADTAYADVVPVAGSLYPVQGLVTCDHAGEVIVRLSSDAGQRLVRTVCTRSAAGEFLFADNPAGYYEIFATFSDDSGAGWMELNVGGATKTQLSLLPPRPIAIEYVIGGQTQRRPVGGRLITRRESLAESGPLVEITAATASFAPGYWEVRAIPPPGYYVSAIEGGQLVQNIGRRKAVQADDWYELFVQPQAWFPGQIRVKLAQDGATVTGKVVQDGKAVAGVPVFLWPVAESARRSLGGVRQTISAVDGSFQFQDLPPGDYRPLATFDAAEPDAELFEASNASAVALHSGTNSLAELPVWLAPW